jgi:hypothetical protein
MATTLSGSREQRGRRLAPHLAEKCRACSCRHLDHEMVKGRFLISPSPVGRKKPALPVVWPAGRGRHRLDVLTASRFNTSSAMLAAWIPARGVFSPSALSSYLARFPLRLYKSHSAASLAIRPRSSIAIFDCGVTTQATSKRSRM